MLAKIKRSRREVFKRSDFTKMADYDQIGRALRELTQDGMLIKIAYGLYAKARTNRITSKPMIASPGGFAEACKEGLDRLKVDWEYNEPTKAYLKGKSLQTPGDFQPVIKDRFSRKFSSGNMKLKVLKTA